MIKNLYYLTKLQICNIFAINEARYSKDLQKRKSIRTTLVAYAILGFFFVFYSVGIPMMLNEFGMASVTPMYLGLMAMALTFGLTFLKAGALFNVKTYEKLAVLPVSNAVVVASRFLSLYIANFLFCFVITASGGIAYGVISSQGVWFYLAMILSGVFLPLLPMAFALTLGVALYSVLSRFKGNNITKTLFTCLFVVVCLAFPYLFQGQSDSEFASLLATFVQDVGGFVLPLTWLSKGVYLSGIGYYFLFVAVSLVVFGAFAFIVGKFYKSICSGLSSSVAKGKYSVGEMKAQSALFALYKREIKGYFSSSLYFMNTAIGYVLAVILAVSVCFTDVSAIFMGLGVDGKIIESIIPFIFALALCLMSSTSCAISMEGKGWELTKSLPVSTKTLMDAKLLTSFTFSIPCTVIGEIALLIALKPTGVALVATLLAPIVSVVFIAIADLFINVKFPMLNWDNEAQAVKQSASVLISMLAGLVTAGIPIVLKFAVPESIFVWALLAYLIVLIGVGVALYQQLAKISLNAIDKK